MNADSATIMGFRGVPYAYGPNAQLIVPDGKGRDMIGNFTMNADVEKDADSVQINVRPRRSLSEDRAEVMILRDLTVAPDVTARQFSRMIVTIDEAIELCSSDDPLAQPIRRWDGRVVYTLPKSPAPALTPDPEMNVVVGVDKPESKTEPKPKLRRRTTKNTTSD